MVVVSKRVFKMYDVVSKEFYEVSGEVFANDYGLNLFIAKTKGGNYQVAEVKTGMLIGCVQRLKRDAISQANELLARADIEQIKAKIDSVV